MDYTCIQCNENEVTVTELYCMNCYLDKEIESLIESEHINQLFTVKEAN